MKLLIALFISLLLVGVLVQAQNCDKILVKQNSIQLKILDLEARSFDGLTNKEWKELFHLREESDKLYDKYLMCII